MELIEVDNTIEALQGLIGGLIQAIYIRPDILCLCDDEGMLKGLPQNYWNDIFGMIVGNVIFCGMQGDDFVSLTDEQVDFRIQYLGVPMISKIE